MATALKNVNRKMTPQTERTRADEVENNAGGYVFKVAAKDRLERFLIIGTDGGTYYASENKITNENVKFLSELIKNDEALVLNTLVDVSVNARAYKNSPSIFALALLFVEGTNKAAARNALPKVCRTSTHLFEFAQYIENLGGWGRAKRNAVADWYQSKTIDELAYQLVKYRQRDGWTHRDLMRLSHPKGLDENLVNFALGKEHGFASSTIEGFEAMQNAGSVDEVISTLETYKNLPWETIPTQFLTDNKVWKALFYNGQLNGQALLRNVSRLVKNDAFNDMAFASAYADRLVDLDMIKRTRLHPLNYLNTIVFSGARGKVKDALDDGFYESFKAIEPAGMRTMLAVDVSASMGWGAGAGKLTAAQHSAALAMVIARSEPMYDIRGFSTTFKDLGISAKTRLDEAMRRVSDQTFGGTDIALPMAWAAKNNVAVDTFVVITDNETWAGKGKPFQNLKMYRDKTGIDARLAVIGVTATDFTVADPTDRGMMDFAGFDANGPRVLADFSAGRL